MIRTNTITKKFFKKLRNCKKHLGRKYYYRILNKYYILKFNKAKWESNNNLIYVDPKNIKYYLLSSTFTRDFRDFNDSRVPKHNLEKGAFSPYGFKNIVLPGDWDLYKKPYEFDNVYDGLSKYFVECQSKEKIELFQTYLIREEAQKQDGYAKKRFEKKNMLYKSIKENGYMSQYELGKKNGTDSPYKRPSEICVNIGRDGELIFNNSDAHHRLAIAKILGINQVPVTIIVRHKSWEKLRRKVVNSTSEGEKEGIYEKYKSHPDIKDLLR